MKNFSFTILLLTFSFLIFLLFPFAIEAVNLDTVKSGNWSDSTIWRTGILPGLTDTVIVSSNHTITYDLVNSKVSGITIGEGATLNFDPTKTATLETDKNIIVNGTLRMIPFSSSIIHTLGFVNIDETKFVGGGMDPIDSDVGLWVMGNGLLDIFGSPKIAWTRLSGSANQGATIITLQSVPYGWQVGDEISIVPSQHPSVGNASWNGFDVRTITSISGTTISLNSPLTYPHPSATDPFNGTVYTAEVLNLTRNVKITGTGDGTASFTTNGRAHIFIRSTVPQFLKYFESRLLGPRQINPDSPKYTQGVLGRYPLHFHHAMDGSRGSLVEGVVVRQGGEHAFVPHDSHGITFRNTIAYDVWDDAYWWDGPPAGDSHNTINDTDDVLYDRAVAALLKFDPGFRGYRLNGFTLRRGNNLTIKNSVAVGVQGNSEASGFDWPEGGHAVWDFKEGNVSHNNKVDGIFAWQNDGLQHIIENFTGYHNGNAGIDHGAYLNVYQYSNNHLFGNSAGIEVRALSGSGPARPDGYRLSFEGVKSADPLEIREHTLESTTPVLYKDCIFSKVIVDEVKGPGLHDFVNCSKLDDSSLERSDFDIVTTQPGTYIRVQRPNGTAYAIDNTGIVTTISPFYTIIPTVPQPSPTPFLKPGDTNNDQQVDDFDLSNLISNFNLGNVSWIQGDFNSSGVVNILDLSILLSNFGI